MTEEIDSYEVVSDKVPAQITIERTEDEYVPVYEVDRPKTEEATQALLSNVRQELTSTVQLSSKEFIDPGELEEVKEKFEDKADEILEDELPSLDADERQIVVGNLLHEMLGLGDIEIVLDDDNLEEVVVNGAQEPLWVYHKEQGWLKTNIAFESDEDIRNKASVVARRVGKQISSLHPLLDAHLPSGDRTNATIFPISTEGNTITIRKFARSPWTITDFIENNTLNKDISALLWMAIQYEMNIIISGGTGSGKTSLLNVLTPFIPPNHRIVSIEDTREISLPEFLHWVPLTTREPNPEGKGGVSMLDLLVNSLRMRPDRIIVGEIRRERQAEVLFEAMHTGHSVYSTLHADTAEQTIRRLINPPINVPETLMESVDLNVVMFRDRQKNIRRAMQVSEVMAEHRGGETDISPNVIYRWRSSDDEIVKQNPSSKMFDQLKMHTGLSDSGIEEGLEDRKQVLDWMLEHEVNNVDRVGKVIAEFYKDQDKIIDAVKDGEEPENVL
ncbi:MAG: type II/IV secretion system ATPase subunit [Candidatus Nanohaloarchaeota archaeon QJJ-7]|nr:type II/IV secretion system ATPase subunit [Candidatus Nanohaloarchaeota archaeon QJJ-7]